MWTEMDGLDILRAQDTAASTLLLVTFRDVTIGAVFSQAKN